MQPWSKKWLNAAAADNVGEMLRAHPRLSQPIHASKGRNFSWSKVSKGDAQQRQGAMLLTQVFFFV